MTYTPDIVTDLGADEVFVFGSNTAGLHYGGAAATAHRHFGAKLGVSRGHCGRTYAIATVNGRLEKLRLPDILWQVDVFKDYARQHPNLTFLVTKIGCGIAGFDIEDIAPMFQGSPDNVLLPLEFHKVLAEASSW